jgi:hypothetical protein
MPNTNAKPHWTNATHPDHVPLAHPAILRARHRSGSETIARAALPARFAHCSNRSSLRRRYFATTRPTMCSSGSGHPTNATAHDTVQLTIVRIAVGLGSRAREPARGLETLAFRRDQSGVRDDGVLPDQIAATGPSK